MANEAARTHELESALKAIINVLEDGQKAMASIADHVKDEGLKVFFLAESLSEPASAVNWRTNFIAWG